MVKTGVRVRSDGASAGPRFAAGCCRLPMATLPVHAVAGRGAAEASVAQELGEARETESWRHREL